MIISGGSRCNGAWFARHLTRTDENERVRVAEMRGMTAESVRDALREMHFVASGTFCKNYFYHASINPRETERLTDDQWERAVDALERNLGLEGQPRFVVEHEKEGRIHRHVVWSRIDADTMTAVSDSFTAPIHERTARELEQEFGLEPVESCLIRDRGTPRPERGPKSWEKFRGFESGIDPDEVKAEVTALWQQCDSGKAFAHALDEAGYILCKGDRRDFCIVDAAGDEHSLARRIKGVKAADIRERMADVSRDELPTVEEGRDLADERADAASSSSSTPHHIEPEKLLEAEKDPDRDRPRLSGKAEPETPDGIPQQAVEGNTCLRLPASARQAAEGMDEARRLVQEMVSARAGTVESELQRPAQSPEMVLRQRELSERTEAQWREAEKGTPAPAESGGGWWQRVRGIAGRAAEIFRDEGSGGSPRWLHMGEEALRAWLSGGENRKAIVELAQDAGEAAAALTSHVAETLPDGHAPPDYSWTLKHERVADPGGDPAELSGNAEPETLDGLPQDEPARPAEPLTPFQDVARAIEEAMLDWTPEPEFSWEDDDLGNFYQPPPSPPEEPEPGREIDGPDMG